MGSHVVLLLEVDQRSRSPRNEFSFVPPTCCRRDYTP
jgi:hypothetical protein